MNSQILQKCVDELKKDTPNIQYVLGMLETLIDISPYRPQTPLIRPSIPMELDHTDEEIIPRAAQVGPIAKLS